MKQTVGVSKNPDGLLYNAKAMNGLPTPNLDKRRPFSKPNFLYSAFITCVPGENQ